MTQEEKGITTLHDLLDYDARNFTAAEVQLKYNLTDWINRASSLQLKAVLLKYLNFVDTHIEKLENFLKEESISAISIRNPVMEAFIEETREKMASCTDTAVWDACLLACIQRINHFKISLYGTAAAYSGALGMDKYAAVFHEAEVNEKHIDDRLSQLAEHEINAKAKNPIVIP